MKERTGSPVDYKFQTEIIDSWSRISSFFYVSPRDISWRCALSWTKLPETIERCLRETTNRLRSRNANQSSLWYMYISNPFEIVSISCLFFVYMINRIYECAVIHDNEKFYREFLILLFKIVIEIVDNNYLKENFFLSSTFFFSYFSYLL